MSQYPDLDKKYGARKVAQAARKIKRETGKEPVCVQLLVELDKKGGK